MWKPKSLGPQGLCARCFCDRSFGRLAGLPIYFHLGHCTDCRRWMGDILGTWPKARAEQQEGTFWVVFEPQRLNMNLPLEITWVSNLVCTFWERRISMGKTRIPLLPSQNLKELSPSNLGSFHIEWNWLKLNISKRSPTLLHQKSWLVWWNKVEAVQCAVQLGDLAENLWGITMVYLPPESTREMLWNGWIWLLLRNGPNSLLEFHFHFSRRLLEQDLFGYAQKGMGWWWMLDVDAFGRLQWRVKRHQQTLVFDSGGPREPPFWGDVRFFKSSIRGRCCNFMQLWSGLSCFPTGWEILRLCALDEVYRVTCQWRLFLTQFKLLNTESCRWVNFTEVFGHGARLMCSRPEGFRLEDPLNKLWNSREFWNSIGKDVDKQLIVSSRFNIRMSFHTKKLEVPHQLTIRTIPQKKPIPNFTHPFPRVQGLMSRFSRPTAAGELYIRNGCRLVLPQRSACRGTSAVFSVRDQKKATGTTVDMMKMRQSTVIFRSILRTDFYFHSLEEYIVTDIQSILIFERFIFFYTLHQYFFQFGGQRSNTFHDTYAMSCFVIR